jgi:L-alanine-DL-glutamate epimerase-like enolase superfamily enzyme
MKITSIDTAIVSVPLSRPVNTPIHHITTVDNVLVTVATDDGPSGLGYLWCFGETRARVLAAMVADLARFAVGRDPRSTAALWQLLWKENNFFGRAGVAMMAQSAIDTGCWDIKGKAAGEPLWRLLGGSARPLPAYAGGLFLNDPVDVIVAEARGYVERGFRAVKMRTGAARLADDIERVGLVRDAIGPDVTLMVDVVQGWTPAQAIRAGRELAPFDLAWIEDPVAFDDLAGLAAVAAALDAPVCAGENDYGLAGFARLFDNGCIDIAMPDLQRVGGVSEWMRVAALADARRVAVTPHVFPEISVHLASAASNVQWIEYVPWWDVLFRAVPALVDGCLAAPDAPGLGLEFDWNSIDPMRIA